MKRIIVSILAILTILTLSIPVFCDDASVGLGESPEPTIVANGLEDFSERLNNLKEDDIEVIYYREALPDTYERVLERIDCGEDVVYIPDIVLEKMEFNMFVRPYDPEYKNTFLGQKYGVTLHEGEEIALDTGCFFSYGGFTADIGYCDDDYLAKYEITLYDKKISYVTYTSSSHLFFEVDGEKIGILVLKQLTDEEIRQLPRGMFYPRILTITDIKNGNFLDADELEDAIVIIDEPTELDDAECVDVN